MTSELKPCPFCGGKAKLYGGPDAQESYSVWCEGSHRINGNFNKDKTIAKWNTRAVPDLPELVRYDKSDICLAIENGYDALPSDGGEYVLYSQAAAMLGAKDAELTNLQNEKPMNSDLRSHWSARHTRMKERAEAAEAELAQIKAQVPVGVIHQGIFYSNGDLEEYPEYSTGTKIYAAPVDQTAEIEMLRKALNLIASETAGLDLHDTREISRAALSGKEPS